MMPEQKKQFDDLSLMAAPLPMSSRKTMMEAAFRMLDPAFETMAALTAVSRTDQQLFYSYKQWARYGAQSVQMPATYAAGLMATDAHNAITETTKLPWPAFEIAVPAGLLESGTGQVNWLYVVDVPEEDGGDGGSKIALVYHDDHCWGVRSFKNLQDMFHKDYPYPSEEIPAGLAFNDEDKEERCWSLITRLVAGVVLAITEKRIDTPGAFSLRPARVKHGGAKANTVNLGKPLKIDCRPAIRAFLSGERERELTLSTWVRGHWRNQAYGPSWSLHRPRWIQPHPRGDGPLNIRPVHLGGNPKE